MIISNANITVERDTCIACGLCVDRCIMDNLRLSLAPCRQACPLHNNCQGYVRLVAMGKEKEAAHELRKHTLFARILGRLCNCPCEQACARGKEVKDGAVHIRAITRYLAHTYPDIVDEPPIPEFSSGKRVAIVGSGPAGLEAAATLSQAGHDVTIMERDAKAGGSLRYGEMAAHLPEEDLNTCLQALIKAGVTMACAMQIDSMENIATDYDAVIVMGNTAGVVPDSSNMVMALDCATSHASVVEAMASGREAAITVCRLLSGDPVESERDVYALHGWSRDYERLPHRAVGGSRGPEGEKDGILTVPQATQEAQRCLSCGRAFEAKHTCWFCLPCEVECPQQALKVRIPYLAR